MFLLQQTCLLTCKSTPWSRILPQALLFIPKRHRLKCLTTPCSRILLQALLFLFGHKGHRLKKEIGQIPEILKCVNMCVALSDTWEALGGCKILPRGVEQFPDLVCDISQFIKHVCVFGEYVTQQLYIMENPHIYLYRPI